MVSWLVCAALLIGGAGGASPAPQKGGGSGQLRVAADTARVHLGPPGGGTDGYVVWPPGKGPAPSVIVVLHWWGVDEEIKDVARRLARQGYVAIVPDLYHGQVASDPDRAHELSRSLDTDMVNADLQSAVSWLRNQPRSAKTKIGVIGFCMGGGLALQFALQSADPCALVMFYGTPESDPQKLALLHAPLQGHFGAKDQGITVTRVEAFRAALKKAGKSAEIYVYPGAGHAFMDESRPSYHADAARQGWARTLAFFQKYLKA